MKRFITVFIMISLCSSIFSQEYWLRTPSPTTKLLMRCCFVDTVFGWAAGDSGVIIATTNGGLNWTVQNSGITNEFIDDIYFLNPRLGWAVSNDYLFNGTYMLYTTNGGNVWNYYLFPNPDVVIGTIYFTDSLKGYASGYSGKIFRTTNGGSSWIECHIDTAGCPMLAGFPKNRIKFLNSNTGFCAGGRFDIVGAMWRTTNAGLNWNTYCLAPEPFYDIYFVSPIKIIGAGGDFEFGASTVTTYDNSANWLYKTIDLFGYARDIAFRTEKEVWLPLAFAQAWAVSTDTASPFHNWISIPAPDTAAVYAAVFKSPTFGFAFGSYGTILKYNTNVIGINNGNESNILTYSLQQNFPNPFNPITNITYSIPKQEFVKIFIYDITGREVRYYPQGFKPAGKYNFKFSANGLASGVYFYKIQAGSYSQSKKMVIAK